MATTEKIINRFKRFCQNNPILNYDSYNVQCAKDYVYCDETLMDDLKTITKIYYNSNAQIHEPKVQIKSFDSMRIENIKTNITCRIRMPLDISSKFARVGGLCFVQYTRNDPNYVYIFM